MSKAAAGGGAGVGPSRRTWDKQEYTEKAKTRDDEDRERAKENQERMMKGKKPARRREELPKATESLKARETPLELDKNVGKTLMVDVVGEGGGRRGPGYYCEICKRTCKDSIGYLDHINGRMHLRRIGQTTQVARSTLDEVREALAQLRAETAAGTRGAETYDFEARLKAIAQAQQEEKERRKRQRREAKERKKAPEPPQTDEDAAMAAMMGFGSFGTKR